MRVPSRAHYERFVAPRFEVCAISFTINVLCVCRAGGNPAWGGGEAGGTRYDWPFHRDRDAWCNPDHAPKWLWEPLREAGGMRGSCDLARNRSGRE